MWLALLLFFFFCVASVCVCGVVPLRVQMVRPEAEGMAGLGAPDNTCCLYRWVLPSLLSEKFSWHLLRASSIDHCAHEVGEVCLCRLIYDFFFLG